MNTVKLPHQRYRITPAGWAVLACLGFWVGIALALTHCA